MRNNQSVTQTEVALSDASSIVSTTDLQGNITYFVEVRHNFEAINLATQEIATGNMDLSNRTEAQASSLEQTAASMKQLTATVSQSAGNAEQANSLASQASPVANDSGGVRGWAWPPPLCAKPCTFDTP